MILIKNNIKFNDNLLKNLKIFTKSNNNQKNINYQQKIPKIIHQTYNVSYNQLNKYLKKCIENIKSLNPEYEHRYYNDFDIIDFIKDNYESEILDIYNSINSEYGSAKADFFRYLLMYKIGGIYLDVKSGANIPFRNIIKPNDEYLLSSWIEKYEDNILKTGFGEYQNWFIICIPNHPFLENVIKKVSQNIINYKSIYNSCILNKLNREIYIGKRGVINLTGPIIYTQAIQEIIHNYDKNYSFKINNYDNSLLYTQFSNKFTHFLLNKNHYSRSIKPIIN